MRNRLKNCDLTHQSHGVDCAAVAEGAYTVRLRAKKGVCAGVRLIHTFDKYRLDLGFKRANMPLVMRDDEFDYYALTLRGANSRFAYLFEITDAKGVLWFFSEEGVARECNWRYAYFSHFQYPATHACDRHVAPMWTQNAVVYQIFPERFYNGTGSKTYITAKWDDEPTPKAFYGGDLEGIRQKLDYLCDLGVNCLYLTPIHPSVSNHKYDVIDYYAVDQMFGGRDAFMSLMRDAKARGLRVLLDGVFNHCSDRCFLFEDVKRRGRQSPYFDWFFIDGDFPDADTQNYQTFAAVSYMPRLNTGNPRVIEYFCDVAAYWIREFGISGWRLDVCDEISDDMLRALKKAVKAADSDAVLIGEVWHESAHWLRGDMLDGVMNYGLTKACIDYIALKTIHAGAFCSRLCRLIWRSGDAANAMMLNLMGSHDTDRFLSRVDGDISRLEMAYATAFFMPGMPCVYYGDEVGLTGGYDPGCRKGFPWDSYSAGARPRPAITALAALKKDGDFCRAAFSAEAINGVACLKRTGEKRVYCLLMNLSRVTKVVNCFGKEYRIAPNRYILMQADNERKDLP